MEDIRAVEELFERYKNNFNWINDIDERLAEKMSPIDWRPHFFNVISEYRRRFQENSEIVQKIYHILDSDLDDALADVLFREAESMYDQDLDDPTLLISVFQKCIAYYDDTNQLDRYILSNGYLCLEVNNVSYNRFATDHFDFSMTRNLLSHKNQYTSLSEDARFRFWVAYYHIIIIGCGEAKYPIDYGFQLYHEMVALWNLPEVQALDGQNERFIHTYQLTRKHILTLERFVKDASPQHQAEFCELCNHYYQEELSAHQNDETEIDILTYKAYMRSLALTKQKKLDDCFALMVNHYLSHLEKINDYVPLTHQEIIFMVSTSTSIIQWTKEDITPSIVTRFLNELITISETKWANLKYYHTVELDTLLHDFVIQILDMPFEKSEKERYMMDLAIKRQNSTFLNAVIVKNIALAIYHQAIKTDIDLFKGISGIPSENIEDFIEKCALFHNFGYSDFDAMKYMPFRAYLSNEQAYLDRHTLLGAQKVQSCPEMMEYADVMRFHHVYYDGTYDPTPDQQSQLSQTKLITDLIYLCDFIEESTSFLRTDSSISESLNHCFQQLASNKGTRFHPVLVDMILSSETLRQEIANYVDKEKFLLLYSIHHSFDIGFTEEEFDRFFNHVLQKINIATNNYDFTECQKLVDQLFAASESDHSPRTIGLAYYASVYLNHQRKYTINVTNDAFEAIRFLSLTEEYDYLAKTYNFLGIHSAYNGDLNNAITNFLYCANYAQKKDSASGVSAALYNVSCLFMGLQNYRKALEYLEKAETYTPPSLYTDCNMSAMKGYYFLKLDRVDAAAVIYQKLQDTILEHPDYPTFVVHIYFACFLFYQGQLDKSKMQIALAVRDQAVLNDYQDHMEEQDIYMELLYQHRLYDDLLSILDFHLEQCEKNKIPYHIHLRLIRKALDCARFLNRTDLIMIYEEKLNLIFLQEDSHKNDIVLQSELSVWDSISLHEKQKQILKENDRLSAGIKEAENASAAKSAFLSSMSHEIRTPIHAILGLDEMILRETKEEHTRRYAEDIQSSGKNLLGLINDILDFSKLEAGKMELIPEEYHTKDMIQELSDQILPRVKAKNLSLHVKMNPAIPSVLSGDDLRIKQVLWNLLTNAVKYTQQGSVTFSIDYEKESDTSIQMKLMIADTGIGMKPEDLDRLTKPFERLDEKRNRSIEGTGLGMSIVTRLLQQMNSSLTVESTYGTGSRFSFILHQDVIAWEPAGILPDTSLAKTTGKNGPLFVASCAKILVVDDNAVNRKVISGLLKRTKVNLTLAQSGQECLELCQKNTFHLILLDHRMPDMDGIETLHRLKQLASPNQNTPVIALTANAISGAYDFYTKEGFDDLLMKPVNSELLEKKVLSFLPQELVES